MNISFIETLEAVEYSFNDVSFSSEAYCEDCDERHNTEDGNCCHSFCASCIILFTAPNSPILVQPMNSLVAKDWYYFRVYHPPVLDPDLKPPFHS